MPQELTTEWQRVISAEQHAELLHTWANLVPLTIAYNSSKQAKTWELVREAFDEETIYKTPRALAKPWNAEAIQKRADELADWAVERWPRHL